MATHVTASCAQTVRVENVHVSYRVYEEGRPRLRQLVSAGVHRRVSRQIHALKGISLSAHEGEAIGVVGANGSGKSTLLQTIAGLLPADEGSVHAVARPALLGVGAVFNPELSGAHNVELGCLALGMKRVELRERFDEIVDFAGVREFIHIPMRAYSSGMRARLNFAVATAVAPEILLIDEALAVGDHSFKERCWQRLDELKNDAGTIFLVSHNLSEVMRMCSRVIWLDRGELMADGDPTEVGDAYQKSAGKQ